MAIKRFFTDLFGIDSASGPFLKNLKFTAGGTESADVNTLDHYEEGTFTPDVTLGGTNVGLTYSTRSGAYTRIGNRLMFDLSVILTAKGSSTGSLLITGLPVVAQGSNHYPVAVSMLSVLATLGDTLYGANVQAGQSYIRLFKMNGAGGQQDLSHADITDTSSIRVCGLYRL